MKSLKIIQTLCKIARIVCKVVFILSLVGAIACSVGILLLAVIPDGLQFGEFSVRSWIEDTLESSLGAVYIALSTGVFVCAGEAVLCKFAEHYFENELKAGTPFTVEGAKELLRLGILTVCIPVATSILAGIAALFIRMLLHESGTYEINRSFGLGITFVILSLFCWYGAEIRKDQTEPQGPNEEQTQDIPESVREDGTEDVGEKQE